MAKLLGVLCFLSCLVSVALASNDDTFNIQGRIYCDTCRAGFETNVTEYIEGAKVKVECKNFTTNEVSQDVPGVTDASGTYNIQIKDKHGDEEICEVVLVSSPREDCNEIKPDRERARIVLARDTGISSDSRFANSLGFLKKDPLPACGALLQMYALADDLDS